MFTSKWPFVFSHFYFSVFLRYMSYIKRKQFYSFSFDIPNQLNLTYKVQNCTWFKIMPIPKE